MRTDHIYLSRYSPGKSIYVMHGGRKITHPVHRNDCFMAAYIAHGFGTLSLEEDKISITEGDIILLRPDSPYRAIPVKDIRSIDIYFCYFTPDFMKSSWDNFKERFPELSSFFEGETPFIHAVDTENKEIRDIFIRMIDEQLSSFPCGYDALKGYLLVALTKIFRNTKTRDFKRIYNQNRMVDEAMRYIYEHMYSRVSLKDLEGHLHVSASFICRMFKKYTGMTTSQFINVLRVDKIKDILKNTDRPIAAISEMFNCNIDYLKQVFKRETGMSMKEYREKYHYKNASDKDASASAAIPRSV